jgi:transglutaminase-like putative cysteine protease
LPVRSELEMQPLGKIVFYRTTRAAATAENNAVLDTAQDIGLSSMIRLNRAIPRPHEASKIVYRITVKDDDKPETALAQDARQKVENAKGQTFELHVQAIRAPQGASGGEKVDEKFLQSCFFIDSDNERVKALAREAVREETDPWKKARAIERLVHDKMHGDSSVAFCTASQAAKELRGDCRQHALLTAAMCRAIGVPSRTALGLIYVNRGGQRPEMGFHMWTEVWIAGEWLGIDATLGRGSVGAAHVKISDHSWHEVQSLTPMLPVARVLGKLSIEVVDVQGSNARN